MSLQKLYRVKVKYRAAVDKARKKHINAIDRAQRKRDKALAKIARMADVSRQEAKPD